MTKDIALLLNYFDMFGTIKENFTRGSMMYNLAIPAKYAPLYQEHIGSLVHADKLMNLVKYVERTDAINLPEENDEPIQDPQVLPIHFNYNFIERD